MIILFTLYFFVTGIFMHVLNQQEHFNITKLKQRKGKILIVFRRKIGPRRSGDIASYDLFCTL